MPKQNSAKKKLTSCTLSHTHTVFKSRYDSDVTSDLYSIGTSVDQETKFNSYSLVYCMVYKMAKVHLIEKKIV